MATAGDGPSATPSLGYGGGNGGAGGKFRKRPFRSIHSTPYDRPPTALRNPSWLSKHFVEPVSKVIVSGFKLFYSSVSRKRLPAPPPPPPVLNQDAVHKQPERVNEVIPAEAQKAAVVDDAHLARSTPDSVSSDLEQLLKRKTFTRSEIDRLTELLNSRAVDLPHQSEARRTELSNGKLAANSDMRQQYVSRPSEEIEIPSDMSRGLISPPGLCTRVLEEDIASPAEIAKAYMGHQASKVSPSMLGSRVRAVSEDATLPTNVPYTPKSTMMSLVTKAVPHVEAPENGYTTPRSRGRSAIYNMARTPYSRVHQTAFEKGSGSRLNGFGGPLLLAPSGKDLQGDIGSNRMGLKRRSSALDDDYGSVGPMRRTRQKPSMLPHKSFLSQGVGVVSSASQHPSTSKRVYKGSMFAGENDVNRTPRTSYAHVPPKSTETASKILDHLERMTPKTKSADLKLIAAKEKSPAKLTTDMLRGQALKSLEDADSTKLLYSDQVVSKLENASRGKEVSTSGSTQEKDKFEENKMQKLGSPSIVEVHAEKSNIFTSGKSTSKDVETTDSVAKSVSQQPQKKQAFMMSAHEDLLDWDDYPNSNGPASEILTEGNANSETIENKDPFSAEKSPDRADAGNASQEKASPSLVVTTVTSSLGSDNAKSASDRVAGSENFSFLPVGEPADPKPWASMQAKADITSRTTASLRTPGSERGINNTIQEAAFANGELGTSPTVGLSSSGGSPTVGLSSSGGLFSVSPFGRTNDGQPAVNPSVVQSASSPASTGLANPFLTNDARNLPSVSTSSSFSALTFPAASSTALSLSTEPGGFSKILFPNFGASGNSSMSTFSTPTVELPATKTGKEENTSSSSNLSSGSSPVGFLNISFPNFGSSGNSSMSTFSTPSAGLPALKTGKEENNSSLSNLPSGSTPAVGSSNFVFSSKVTSFPAVSQSQASLSSSGSGSVLNAQSPVAGSEISSVATPTPFNFGGSGSSLVFGTSGVASLTSTTTAAKLFSSVTGNLGNSTSGSLSETKSSDPKTGSTPSLFGFNANTSSVTTTTMSSGTAAASPFFKFGDSSSAGNMVSSSSGSTSIFGASSLSPSTESNPATSSGTTASNIFSSNWPAAKPSSNGSLFSTPASTGFTFGSSPSIGSTSTAPMVFGAPSVSSSGPVFSFSASSAPSLSTPSPFGSQPVFGGGAAPFAPPVVSSSNDQMSTEDSMAEDPVQSSMPAAPAFGQQPGFMFAASPAPSQANPFQFGAPQNQPAPQNPPLYQGTGSGSFSLGSGGGSFSLGSGGGDKSNRKFIKVQRGGNRRKK